MFINKATINWDEISMPEIRDLYFEFMYSTVVDESITGISYRNLFHTLDSIIFEPILAMDENRAVDGSNLKYNDFADYYNISNDVINKAFGNNPCSVLEVLIALSLKIESELMTSVKYGNRTGQWFWTMINNLGLNGMSDEKWNMNPVAASHTVTNIINVFLDRQYQFDGTGGNIVIFPDTIYDLRLIDIWTQMSWYLNSFISTHDGVD